MLPDLRACDMSLHTNTCTNTAHSALHPPDMAVHYASAYYFIINAVKELHEMWQSTIQKYLNLATLHANALRICTAIEWHFILFLLDMY